MAKHHPDLDLFGLVMGDVEKELMFDRPSKATAENVTEEAIDIAGLITTPVDLVPESSNLYTYIHIYIYIYIFIARQEQYFSLGPLFWATKQFLWGLLFWASKKLL